MLRRKLILTVLLIIFISSIVPLVSNISFQAKLLADYTNVTVNEAHDLIENTTSLFILDVRTQDEFSIGHIANSTLIPHDEITSRSIELPQNRSWPFLVYCRTGYRSAIASQALVDLNFTNIYNMLGGFSAWKDAGYPFEGSVADPTGEMMQYLIFISIFGIILLIIIVVVREYLLQRKNRR